MEKQHSYTTTVHWTGNGGSGTSGYRQYERTHTISVENKSEILASSDPAFRGDPTRYNPEELFVASLASCHMLWYLHLCSEAGVVIMAYVDSATGIMLEDSEGGGKFSEVTLQPRILVKDRNMIEKAKELHKDANKLCFIANSVNFNVAHRPIIDCE